MQENFLYFDVVKHEIKQLAQAKIAIWWRI